MRRIILCLSALLMAVTAAAGPGDAYFCCTEGARLHYERTVVKDGSLRWRHVMSIERCSAGGDISYNSLFTKPGGGTMYGGPVALKVTVKQDGDVEMDAAQAVAAVFSNILGTRNVRTSGGLTVLPSDMEPGDTLPDVSGSATAGPVSMKVDVTGRKVLRRETLTTAAGTFDCIVVQEHKVEKGSLRNRVTTAQTWYARGVGMVRHDTYDKHMELETTEVLVKITE